MEHDDPEGTSLPVCRYTSYTVVSDVEHARKFSSLGLVVMIVSPSRAQSVVVAVAPSVSALYDAVPLATFR